MLVAEFAAYITFPVLASLRRLSIDRPGPFGTTHFVALHRKPQCTRGEPGVDFACTAPTSQLTDLLGLTRTPERARSLRPEVRSRYDFRIFSDS